MYLNLYEDHFSYITNIKAYCQKFECRLCKKLFSQKCHCQRHEKVCNKITNLSVPKTIFEKLEEFDISVEQSKREYPWFIVFDMEAVLIDGSDEDGNVENNESLLVKNLKWTTRHDPISVSICSNVDGLESEKFILDPDIDSLLEQMLQYMTEIANKSYELSQVVWKDTIEKLNQLEEYWLERVAENPPDDDDEHQQ